MIAYIIKTILCSSLFYVLYIFYFEKENMHLFKRAFLLNSLIFSLLTPLIMMDLPLPQIAEKIEIFHSKEEKAREIIIEPEQEGSLINTTDSESGKDKINLPLIAGSLYAVISCFILIRFLNNLTSMTRKIKTREDFSYKGVKVILIPEQLVPHSFANCILINKDDYENNLIPEEILIHEWVHAKQKHFLDIIFLELLLVFFWFNPCLYLYRKKIQLNHEFLADEGVIKRDRTIIPAYQTLLINTIDQNKSMRISCYFNYLVTKKRLIMMTKTTSRRKAWTKAFALVPISIAAILLFSSRIIAQSPVEKPQRKETTKLTPPTKNLYETMPNKRKVPSSGEASEAQLKEYKELSDKYETIENGYITPITNISESDRKRMESLFLCMSEAQRVTQRFGFRYNEYTMEKIAPPAANTFNSWKDPNEFGVWLNGTKIDNSKLNDYTISDIGHYNVSKLYPNAKKGKKYNSQVNLYTNEYIDSHNKKLLEDNKLYFYWRDCIQNPSKQTDPVIVECNLENRNQK